MIQKSWQQVLHFHPFVMIYVEIREWKAIDASIIEANILNWSYKFYEKKTCTRYVEMANGIFVVTWSKFFYYKLMEYALQ